MVDFKFYLNRQGPRGQQGEQGEQGFSPSITINSNTASEFTLLVTNENDSFVTPNLRGDQVTDMGGTYIRYNPETRQMYAGYADTASDTQRGEVLLASDEDIELGTSGVVVTADQLKTALDAAIEKAGGDVEALRTEMQTAISGLTASISTETSQRTLADNALSARIDSEVSTRVTADTALSARIDSIVIPDISNLATKDELAEVEAEIPDVSNLVTKSELSTEVTERTNADTSLATSISTVASSIPDVSGFATTTQLSQEASTRSSEDARLEGLINSITVPTVNDPTITFNYGTTPIGDFTLNQSTAETITIPEVTVNTATSSTPGIVQPDNTSIVINNGVISATAQTPTQATSTTLGIVKPDNNTIVVDANGVISATASGGVQIDDTTTTTNATWSSEKINTSIQVGDEAVLETVMENFIANDGLVAGEGISLTSTTTTTGATQITIESTPPSADLTVEGLETHGNLLVGVNGMTNIGDFGYASLALGDTGLVSSDKVVIQVRARYQGSSYSSKQQFRLVVRDDIALNIFIDGSTLKEWTGSTNANIGTFPEGSIGFDANSYDNSIITYRLEIQGTSIVAKYKFDSDNNFTTLATGTLYNSLDATAIYVDFLGNDYDGRNAQGTIYFDGTQIEDGSGNILWRPKVTGLVDATISEFTEVNPTAKEQVISWGMPDYNAGIDISTFTSSSNQFTAPCDGIINYNGRGNEKTYLNGNLFNTYESNVSSSINNILLFLNKNDTFYATGYGADTSTYINKFFPMKGAN